MSDHYSSSLNSYGCYALALTVLREQAVRARRVMPVSVAERIQREQGPVEVWELDCVRATRD